MGRQFWVKCVYAFNHKHVVFLHFQLLSTGPADTRLEVILGQFNLFATEKCIELFVDKVQVEGINAFIVVFSVLIMWCLVAVNEVVVKRNLQGFQSVCHKLYGKTFARCGLSRRRRTGKKHQLYTLPTGNFISNLRYFLLLKCL